MVAGASACTCSVCGTTCTGRFNGCPDVWARGPVVVTTIKPREPVVFAEPAAPPPWAEAPPDGPPPWAETPAEPPNLPPRRVRRLATPDLETLQQKIAGLRGELRMLSTSINEQVRARRSEPSVDA